MKILVVAPMASEKENITKAIDRAKSSLKNQYTVIRGRVGKVYAAAATAVALERDHYDCVAVIGYAAASAALSKGDVVAPCWARYHDVDVPDGLDGVSFLTDPYELAGRDDVTIFTGDAFVGAAKIRTIMERFGTERALFDMEATAVCQTAALYGVKAMVVKMVSDTPEKGCDADSFERFVTEHTDFGPLLELIEKTV